MYWAALQLLVLRGLARFAAIGVPEVEEAERERRAALVLPADPVRHQRAGTAAEGARLQVGGEQRLRAPHHVTRADGLREQPPFAAHVLADPGQRIAARHLGLLGVRQVHRARDPSRERIERRGDRRAPRRCRGVARVRVQRIVVAVGEREVPEGVGGRHLVVRPGRVPHRDADATAHRLDGLLVQLTWTPP